MIRSTMTALSLVLLASAGTADAGPPKAKPSALRASPRVESLLARMTLDEKLGQLVQMPGGRETGLGAGNVEACDLVVPESDAELGDLA